MDSGGCVAQTIDWVADSFCVTNLVSCDILFFFGFSWSVLLACVGKQLSFEYSLGVIRSSGFFTFVVGVCLDPFFP